MALKAGTDYWAYREKEVDEVFRSLQRGAYLCRADPAIAPSEYRLSAGTNSANSAQSEFNPGWHRARILLPMLPLHRTICVRYSRSRPLSQLKWNKRKENDHYYSLFSREKWVTWACMRSIVAPKSAYYIFIFYCTILSETVGIQNRNMTAYALHTCYQWHLSYILLDALYDAYQGSIVRGLRLRVYNNRSPGIQPIWSRNNTFSLVGVTFHQRRVPRHAT